MMTRRTTRTAPSARSDGEDDNHRFRLAGLRSNMTTTVTGRRPRMTWSLA